ncbi:MAG: methylmalonyl-CoA mutase family protein, partial [Bdellovibrionaceae bacterium]|nr:methylmalonyl-CoA mutase family protein [Pseudobdellovibrionaceae bacterium]
IIGVNTFIDPDTLREDYVPPKIEMARASYQEKQQQLQHVKDYKKKHEKEAQAAIQYLKQTVIAGGNIFAALMDCARVCTLGQITQALFEVGGQYRRNM